MYYQSSCRIAANLTKIVQLVEHFRKPLAVTDGRGRWHTDLTSCTTMARPVVGGLASIVGDRGSSNSSTTMDVRQVVRPHDWCYDQLSLSKTWI